MVWTRDDIPDLGHAVAVVTGAGHGLGRETAHGLAAAGAHVVLAGRNPYRLYDAAGGIAADVRGASLAILPVDLASLEVVRGAAGTLLSAHERIDILVNNAGVMAPQQQRTEDGFERQWGVNHLGHFALAAMLLPALLRADAARVVSVTSTAHHLGRAAQRRSRAGDEHPGRTYGRSKLATYHFALGLHYLFGVTGAPAASLVADPGLSPTGLLAAGAGHRSDSRSQRLLAALATLTDRFGAPPEQAALPQLRAAADPHAHSGEFYAPRLLTTGPPVRRPVLPGGDRAVRRLWEASQRDSGLVLDAEAVRGAYRNADAVPA